MSFPCAPKPSAFPPETKKTNNLGQWLHVARARLVSSGADSDAASLETALLAAHVFQRPRSWVLAHLDAPISPAHLVQLDQLLVRLSAAEPLAYLTGRREFYKLDFFVTPEVLVPRPETELLVERALDWLRRHPSARSAVDVGAGSGCIAVTLAKLHPDLRVTAIDRSYAALQVARRNALHHQVTERIAFVQGDLLAPFMGRFDLICANLPYIPSSDLAALPVSRHEPLLALDGGSDGLELIRRLLAQIPLCLVPGGLALLEIENRQGQSVLALAQTALPDAMITKYTDLAGLDRLIQIERIS